MTDLQKRLNLVSTKCGKNNGAIIAANYGSPNLASKLTERTITANECRALRDLHMARAENKRFFCPFIYAKNSRKYRTPTALKLKDAAALESRTALLKENTLYDQLKMDRIQTRKALKQAAHLARNMGNLVSASFDRNGRISSYYFLIYGRDIRISDHKLPWTPKRDFMAKENGRDGFEGFHGGELIVDSSMKNLRIKRKLILIAAGR